MSVVVIGDRAVGKTSMVVALASDRDGAVKIIEPDPEMLLQDYPEFETGKMALTQGPQERPLVMSVERRGGKRKIEVQWIDTPGEAWQSREWQEKNADSWQGISQKVSKSQGVILLLPPHRGLVRSSSSDLQSSLAWGNRVTWWLNFLKQNCNEYQHILICLNKADIFCNIEKEGKKWEYTPSSSFLYKHSEEVYRRYFNSVNQGIQNFNNKRFGNTVKFFLTTIKNRTLLELPWIYLAPHIDNLNKCGWEE